MVDLPPSGEAGPTCPICPQGGGHTMGMRAQHHTWPLPFQLRNLALGPNPARSPQCRAKKGLRSAKGQMAWIPSGRDIPNRIQWMELLMPGGDSPSPHHIPIYTQTHHSCAHMHTAHAPTHPNTRSHPPHTYPYTRGTTLADTSICPAPSPP